MDQDDLKNGFQRKIVVLKKCDQITKSVIEPAFGRMGFLLKHNYSVGFAGVFDLIHPIPLAKSASKKCVDCTFIDLG